MLIILHDYIQIDVCYVAKSCWRIINFILIYIFLKCHHLVEYFTLDKVTYLSSLKIINFMRVISYNVWYELSYFFCMFKVLCSMFSQTRYHGNFL